MRKTAQQNHPGYYIFLGVTSLIILIPFIWVLMASLKTKSQYLVDPNSWPNPMMFSNYIEAFQTINMPNLFKNSILLSVSSVVGALVLTTMSAFVLSRFHFSINRFVYAYYMMGMMIPLNAAIIPLFINLKTVGLTNSYIGVIIPYIAFNTPMGIFLITNYMNTIPRELEEAAVIDGCNSAQLLVKVLVPIAKPIFATYSIVSFMSLWNEFLFALVLLTGEQFQTVPLGLATFRGQYDTNTTVMLAATVIAMTPTIIVYILLRDQIVKGMTAGAVKG